MGQLSCLIVSIPDLFPLSYFAQGHYAITPLRLEPVAFEKMCYVNSYSVIHVLNTFQATIVLMGILDR